MIIVDPHEVRTSFTQSYTNYISKKSSDSGSRGILGSHLFLQLIISDRETPGAGSSISVAPLGIPAVMHTQGITVLPPLQECY